MILKKLKKQPRERKDYAIDYAEWLAPASDSLATVTTTVTTLVDGEPTDDPGTGVGPLIVDAVDLSATQARLWIAGGIHDADYKVTILVTTDGGREDESELIFRVRDI